MASVLQEFKLDHLLPGELILSQIFSIILMLYSHFLLPQRAENEKKGFTQKWMSLVGGRYAFRGALHKIGRFRNVPTEGTFINKLKIKFINKRTYGRYVSETTYFM